MVLLDSADNLTLQQRREQALPGCHFQDYLVYSEVRITSESILHFSPKPYYTHPRQTKIPQ
jgi:hypothetical protein